MFCVIYATFSRRMRLSKVLKTKRFSFAKVKTIMITINGKAEDDYGNDENDEDHKYKVQRLFLEKCSVLTLKFSHSRRESNSPLN